MGRHAVAAAVALCLVPAWLSAQTTTFTVTVASANVHKGPSTGSAIIGQAPRGAVLPVTRELGSWVKVSWKDAPDGGYMHVSWGSMARAATTDSGRPAANAAPPPPPPAADPAPPVTPSGATENTRPVERPAPARRGYILPATHVLGVGARIGASPIGFGGTARSWRGDRFGVQVDVLRYAVTNDSTAARMTSWQVEPSALYSLSDRVTDYVWIRPYVGAGATLRHHSISDTPGAGGAVSGNGFGLQAFGGGEFTFANAPQFAVSADLSYQWFRTPLTGFDLGGLGLSVSGHWYVK